MTARYLTRQPCPTPGCRGLHGVRPASRSAAESSGDSQRLSEAPDASVSPGPRRRNPSLGGVGDSSSVIS